MDKDTELLGKDKLPHNDMGRAFLEKYGRALKEVHKPVIALDEQVELLYIGILAKGHVILEGDPGVGKTLLANAVGRTINAQRSRIQCTPDLKPAEILYRLAGFGDKDGGGKLQDMRLGRGALFTQFLLADEINRLAPKTCSVFLEVLEEQQITFENETVSLGEFYVCAATQNRVESSQSTNQLPEALMERFMLNILVPYPSPELRCRVDVHNAEELMNDVQLVFDVKDFVEVGNAVFDQYVRSHDHDDVIVRYSDSIIDAIFNHAVVRSPKTGAEGWAPGIRAGEDMLRAAAARAFLNGRDRIEFGDIRALARPVLRFKFSRDPRLSRKYGITSNNQVIEEVLRSVPIGGKGV
ncbi:MAG: MoxR family ATPase [bacterium]|nr:MoxR family ATPase [bacterium]